jgi:hypothetical protein
VTSHPGRLTADFEFDRRYELIFDKGRQVYFVDDSEGRSVAVLPVGFGGEVKTRTDSWNLETEHRRLGWAVVARTLSDRSEVGSISDGLIPDTYKLHVGRDCEYRVTQNPLTCHWTISEGRSHLAAITDIAHFAAGRAPTQPKRASAEQVSPFTSPVTPRPPNGIYAGAITTHDGDPGTPLALAILLTLEMIKADAAADLGLASTRANDGSGVPT